MKKILYSAAIALAALAAASCVQEHIEAVYNPENVTAQTLGQIAGTTLAEDGPAITATFNAADFGSGLATTYTLFADLNSSMENKTKIGASIDADEGTISFSQKEINNLILNNGGEADTPVDVYFVLYAYLSSDKNAAIESSATASNVVSANFTAYNAELRDSDKYPVAYIPGGYQVHGDQGSGWVFTDEQYLFDYAGDGVYYGLLDVYESGAAGQDYGFKFTLEASWDNGDYGDAEGSPTGSEPGSMDIHSKNDGGDDNILCFDIYRYYFFVFDTNAMTLTKKYAFHNVGIVGDFNSWNAADADMKMTYNKYYHRFYIDHTFDTDAKLKFTCDDAWDTNWGVDCAGGGADIDVAAGSYRIYLDLNKESYEFNTKMFGQEEPGGGNTPEPEPEPAYEGWGIIGVGGDWETDIAMTESDGVWTGYATLAATDEWKIRKDAAWDENRGAEGDSPVTVTLDTPLAVVNNGQNLAVPADGFYKVVYDSNAETITVSDGEVWSIIGAVGGTNWDTDFYMTKQGDGTWLYEGLAVAEGDQFKIRYNNGWDVNRGAADGDEPGSMTVGNPLAVANGGKNLTAPAGTYNVIYNPTEETILIQAYIPSNLWSIIGAIMDSNWDKDFYMTKQGDGTWLYEGLEIAEGNAFKIRYNNGWDVNRGAADGDEPVSMTVGTPLAVANGGKNLTGPAGTYNLIYNPDDETMTLAAQDKGWGICGDYNGWGATADVQLVETFPGIFISEPVELTAGWKIRYNNGWDVNFGGATPTQQGEFVQAVAGGADISLAGTFKVVYNANNGTIGTLGWGVTGSIASAGVSWDKDIPMNLTSDGTWVSVPVALTTSDNVKIRWDAGWDVNRGGTCTDIDEPFAVANNGADIAVPSDGTYVIIYNPAEEQMSISSSVIGLIGEFNSWGGDEFMFYAGEGKFYAYNRKYEGGWKIRFSAGWDENRGAPGDTEPYEMASGSSVTATANGKNLTVTDAGLIASGYTICYDAEDETISVN